MDPNYYGYGYGGGYYGDPYAGYYGDPYGGYYGDPYGGYYGDPYAGYGNESELPAGYSRRPRRRRPNRRRKVRVVKRGKNRKRQEQMRHFYPWM